MLVFRNEVRIIIDNLSVFEHSTRSNQLTIVIVANDQVRRHDIDNAEIRRFFYCAYRTIKPRDYPGIYQLFQICQY